MKHILILSLVIMIGCASKPLTPEEQAVRILRKSDPDKSCKEVQAVYASGFYALNEIEKEKELKRATLKVGANTVTYDRTDENGTIYGTAFKCP